MSQQFYGMPTAAQILTVTDNLATLLKNAYSVMGTNAPADSTGLAALADTARRKILGDAGANVGLGNPVLERDLIDSLNSQVQSLRYDVLFARTARGFFDTLSNEVLNFLPSGWSMQSGGITQAIDAHLLRLNGAHTGVPTTPAAAGTLTAVNNVAGTFPNVLTTNRPFIAHTLVGANDYDESLPSPEATLVDITGGNDAYSYQIAGNVPAGVTKVRMYRSFIGGLTGVRYWFKDVSSGIVAGSAYPAILITEADSALRVDLTAPSWLSCGLVPEAAALLALAYSSLASGDLAGNLPRVFSSTGMFSPSNVLLGLASAFLGVGNPAQSGLFGTSVLTGAATQTYTAGSLQVANNAPANVQGFAGALGNGTTGLNFRVSAVTNGSTTLTFSYTYYDAANGWGNTQTLTGQNVTIAGTAVGSVQGFAVTSGRVVTGVTVTAKSGASTSGTIVVEGVAPRAY